MHVLFVLLVSAVACVIVSMGLSLFGAGVAKMLYVVMIVVGFFLYRKFIDWTRKQP